ncbi:hypothetical protein BEWA_025220 [Theileria equi strain WA]|uniref:Uncharacterized protein n=1 Tax=Theileria equi strain WA TaxID=1537102 RepID=L0AWN8_THEEQ|nr:hypothetical protein BEWA_025220 [Theileria equi strain WA]AFZ79673.1 hypothetical protein BEWA_025220 [Theileria equi strain WA]|eukprot:XP_004829339.1 hypothetical protein BEWA_025220 [Theileria equi strain WA]
MDGLDVDYLYKNNKNHSLVDSLPFVDTIPVELEPTIQELVQDEMKLILEESGCSEEELLNKYLAPIPYERKENGCLYNLEINRIQNGEEKEGLNFKKYSEIDSGDNVDAKLEHMKMLMEYSQGSLINLELMDRYKEGSWLKYLDSLTLLKLGMEKEKNQITEKVEEINKRRKLSQIECANRLRSIGQEYEDLINKNKQLFFAIEELQQKKRETILE